MQTLIKTASLDDRASTALTLAPLGMISLQAFLGHPTVGMLGRVLRASLVASFQVMQAFETAATAIEEIMQHRLYPYSLTGIYLRVVSVLATGCRQFVDNVSL